MPHYYFDLDECGDVTVDEEGRDLPDTEAARADAIREARQLMSSEILRGRLCPESIVRVRDEAGSTVFAIRFEDAVMP